MIVEKGAEPTYFQRQELERRQHSEWLQGLYEGSGVVVMDRGEPYVIATVGRVTATQLILSDGRGRFRRDTGRQVGNPHGMSIRPITDGARAFLQAKSNRSELSTLTYRIDRLSDAEVAVMLDALKAYWKGLEDSQ